MMEAETRKPAAPGVTPPADQVAGEGKGSIGRLLKSPGSLAKQITEDRDLWRCGLHLLFWGLVCHSLYGVAMALYGGLPAAGMTVLKAPAIALSSILLCLPSLYVFSAVGGCPLSPSQAFAVGGGVVGMIGLLLLGLAPVAWLFAVSTKSCAFTVLFSVTAWFIAVGFARRFINQLRTVPSFSRTTGMKWWLLIYILVSLQMITTQRPLLERPGSGWYLGKKQFFLVHFAWSLGGGDERGN